MSPPDIRKLKVCFILPVPLLPLKGASFTCWRQAVEFRNHDVESVILCPKLESRPYPKESHTEKVHILDSLPPKRSGLSGHLKSLMLSYPAVSKALEAERPDIVHIHNPPDVIPMIASFACRSAGIPFVFQLNDPGPESMLSLTGTPVLKRKILFHLSRFLEGRILPHAKGLMTVNDVLRQDMVRSRKKIDSIPFITQYNLSSLRNEKKDPVPNAADGTVLYIGNLSTGFLGLEEIIRSFRSLWEKYGVKLTIIGDGPLKESLERAAHSSGASEFVDLVGYVDPEEIPGFLEKAVFCMIPYLDTVLTRVSTPTKLFEYLSFGKAVVCPDFPGFVEILGPNNPGVYRSDLPGDILRVMDNLLRDGELRSRTEQMNLENSRKYDFPKEMKKILDLYETALKGVSD